MKFARSSKSSFFETLDARVLLAFGKTDITFGQAGRAVTELPAGPFVAMVKEINVTPAGAIVAGGDAGVVRYTPAGKLDSTFGDGGIAPLSGVLFRSQTVDSEGNVFTLLNGPAGTIVAKFGANGQPDRSFGESGTAIVTSTTSFAAKALAVDDDGKIIVAGTRKTGPTSAVVRVYRLDAGGAPDNGFAQGGMTEFQFGQGASESGGLLDRVVGVAIVNDNQILIGGGSVSLSDLALQSIPVPIAEEDPPVLFGGVFFATALLEDNGQLDGDYGQNGIARAIYATGPSLDDALDEIGITGVLPTAFAVTSRGEAILAADPEEFSLASFDESGNLKFNVKAEPGFPLEPTDIVALSDGRAAVVGLSGEDSVHRGLVMTHISPDGAIGNPVFTDDLIESTTDLAGETAGVVALSSDGRLLVGGAAEGRSAYEVVKFSAGKITEPRPDEFLGATVNDIARDPAGGLHVAFYDSNSTTLKYAYRAPNGLWNGAVTVDATPNVGGYLSLAINSANQPSIAYFNGASADLCFASTSTGGKAWSIETIDHKGSVGQYPSLIIDSDNRPRVSYYRKSSGDLRYAVRTSGGWRIQTVDGADTDVGRSSALVINPRTGRPTVAYTDGTIRQIKYAGQTKAGTWDVQTAAKFKGGADHLSMAYSYYFGPMISYYDTRTTDLKLAYYTGSEGWRGQVVGDESAQGLYPALTFPDYYGDPSVYAYNRASDKVVLFNESTDEVEAASVVTGGGNYLSIAYDGICADIAYFDTATGLLKIRWTEAPEAS